MAVANSLSLTDIKEIVSANSQKEQGRENLKITGYELQAVGDAPVGFLGHHQFLNVHVKRQDLNQNEVTREKLTFFLKSAPKDVASRMEYIEEFGVFEKEMNVYRDVLPKLQDVNAKIGNNCFSARCFYAQNDILVFENLSEQGFRMSAHRSGILDFEHLNCALKALADMHSASIVMEAKDKIKIPESYKSAVVENAYPDNKTSIRFKNFHNAVKACSQLIGQIPKYKGSAELEYILSEFPKQMERIFQLCKPSSKYQNVFCHADLWANNVMFKYENGIATEARLVDFQLARYAPPVTDVITILTIPTTREFRRRHLNELLSNYYNFVHTNLASHGLHLKDFLPKSQFDESVREGSITGLIESILFSHLTILPTDCTKHLTSDSDGFGEFFDKQRTDICLKAFQSDQTYRERMTDMLSAFVDDYILETVM